MSYAVIIPTYHQHFHCLLRLLRSIRDKVTDSGKFQLVVVTGDNAERVALQSLVNNFVPGSDASILDLPEILRQLRIFGHPDVFQNLHGKQHFTFNYLSMKKLMSLLAINTEHAFVLDADSYVYRETSVWDDIIQPYLQRPVHYSYIPPTPFLRELVSGACHLLRRPLDTSLGYNFEYQNWVFERSLLQNFAETVATNWGATSLYDAIYQAVFRPGENAVFFDVMAYRYFLADRAAASDPRLTHYQFVDSYDVLAGALGEQVMALTKPREFPIERLASWIHPQNYTGMQLFLEEQGFCMLRLDAGAAHPWLVRQMLQDTPAIKWLVCSRDYELYC